MSLFFQQGVHGTGPNPFLDVREDEISSYPGERRPLLFSREEETKAKVGMTPLAQGRGDNILSSIEKEGLSF